MCILCHLPKFGFGANMGFVDMVNQIMSGMVIQFTRKLILINNKVNYILLVQSGKIYLCSFDNLSIVALASCFERVYTRPDLLRGSTLDKMSLTATVSMCSFFGYL